MHDTQDNLMTSLELHLFFARIMKEHALFLKAGFLPPNAAMAREAEFFLRQFERILSRAITLSQGMVRCCVLDSGEVVTEFTDCAEQQTQRLTGIRIDRALTARALRLRGRECAEPDMRRDLAMQVRQLNRDALALVERLIAFKERLLSGVGSCDVFTANYPLLIEHILREARLYRAYILQMLRRGEYACRELQNSELFWNRIMMEHALFIRGLLDPTECELIETSNGFAADYKRLLETSAAANDRTMGSADSGALELTEKFRDFKRAGVAGIEACKIRSIILPLLADHVLREANHYIRILEE